MHNDKGEHPMHKMHDIDQSQRMTDAELDKIVGGFALPGLGWAIELIGRGLQTAFKGQNGQPGRVEVFGSRPL